MWSRRHFTLSAAAAAFLPFAGRALAAAPEMGTTLTEAQREAGKAFVARNMAVDIHAHPGRFFMVGSPPTPMMSVYKPSSFEKEAIDDIRSSGLSAVMFSAVSDHPLLGPTPDGPRATRAYRPGEAFADYRRQLALMKDIVRRHQLGRGRDSRDIRDAFTKHKPACVFSVEGGDFIEDRLDRVDKAARDGVRAITIIHYRVNQIGDNQTSPPVHNGLTPLGKDTVRRMNRAGIIVDLAHASYDATKQAADVSDKPMMISHSNLKQAGRPDHVRLLTPEHARIVTGSGGLIGAVPAGFGYLKTFADFIGAIVQLVDTVGVDHVAIGTDMDYTPASVVPRYADWSLIPAALLAHGMHEAEVAKIIGGNFLRLLDATTGGKA